ncbi:MAG: substrate-binding domain-containing protein, partial [bacterium]|nr:substrate-binding domain-containing protein [bacterium]
METIHHTNIFSSSHSRRTCPTVGVLSHGFTDSPLWAGIADTAGQRGVTLIGFAGGIPASPHGFEAQANVLFDLVNPEIIDGLIVDSDMLCHYIGMPALRAFCDRYPLPLVSSGVPLNGIPSVLLDFSQGMRDVLAHLIETHGYRRIAFIRGPATSRTGEERYTAYQEALAAYEIAFDPQLVTPGSFYAPSGADAIRLLYDDRKVQVDAIVAANDFMAIDAMHALQVRGIRVPEDVAVVGFDDMEEARAGTPPLTTVNFCIHDRSLHLMELLLANMAGEHAPEQVSLSPSLIVRESCGCRSAAVMEASAATVSNVVGTPPTFASQRNSLLAAIGRIPTVRSKDIPRIATLFDGFVTDIMNPSAGVFLAVWQDIVRRAWTTGSDFSCWQRVLSMLRNGLRPCFDSVATLTQAENLWQQARILLGEALERAQHVQRIQREHQFVHLRKISQSLIATFDVAELMNLLIRELSQIGVLSCFLALYDDPDTPTGTARLLLAYTDHNRISLPAEGYRFPAIQLIPPEFFPQERRMTLIMDALYFQEVQLGFVLFELDTDSQILHTSGIRNENPLCGEISSALQGALLVRRIREHAAQVTRQQYILDTFMANVPDAIYFKDTESRFIRANRAMARTFDVHDPADLAGKTDFDLFPESQAQSKYEQEQEILCNGQALVSLEEPDAQGGWVSTTKMPLRDEHGSIIGTFGVSRDITALKQTEQELRQYRTHLEELVAERTCDLSRTNTRLRDEIIERRQVEADLIQSNSRLHDEIV